ncbi:MAG: TonB-dependent receptor [Pseudomonadota bacterium]
MRTTRLYRSSSRDLQRKNSCRRSSAIRPGLLASAVGAALLGGGLTPTPATAQEGAEVATEGTLETVLVTARRRAESLQDVPLGITAFDADAIKRRNITELDDVARFTAGFAFEDFDGGNGGPVIRSQPTINVTSREQTTATFLDGIYLPRSWLVDLGVSNLQRIEIVKGPQSARYGRNAFAGAINYIPQKAGGDLDGELTLTGGSDERFDYGGAISIPVIEDKLYLRASFDHTEFDGSWRNDHPDANRGISPGTEGNVGGWDTDTYSLNVLFNATEDLTLDLSYYGFDREEEARASQWRSTGLGQGNCGSFLNGGFRLFCGEPPAPADSVLVQPRGFSRQSGGDIIRFEADYQINETFSFNFLFGNVDADTLSAVSAESDPINCGTILSPFIIQGGVSLCNFQASPLGEVDYDSYELRLDIDNGGPWTGSVGAFIGDGTDNNFFVSVSQPADSISPLNITRDSTGFLLGGFPFNPDAFGNLVVRDDETVTEVASVFGEVNYAFANGKTRLGLEARFTNEEITTTGLSNGLVLSRDDDFITPRITLEHDLSDDTLLYGTIARGAKAGGFNSGAIEEPERTFDSEFNTTFEVGAKNTLLGGAAVLNAALYYTDWSDMQVTAADPNGSILNTAITLNFGDASIWGLELEGSWLVNDNLSLDASFAYSEAEYDNATDTVFARIAGPFTAPPCDDIVCSSDGDVSGNRLPRTPTTQIAVGGQWRSSLDAWGADYFVRADVAYQSSFFGDTINAAQFPSRTVANLRTGLEFGNIDVALWARNLTDEKYASNALTIIQAAGSNLQGAYYGERRTYGITATYRFR